MGSTGEVPKIRVVSAAIVRDGAYLITQRREQAVLPLLWEFPGGRVEPGETDAEALQRELRERLGVTCEVGEMISETEHTYEKYVVSLALYACTPEASEEPRAVGVESFQWVESGAFERYQFTPADQASMDALLFGEEH